jgi:hypothetical protein
MDWCHDVSLWPVVVILDSLALLWLLLSYLVCPNRGRFQRCWLNLKMIETLKSQLQAIANNVLTSLPATPTGHVYPMVPYL